MGTVRYTVVNGVVRSENRNGVARSYSLDPLGNTRALYDTTTTRTDTFKYFPSGTVSARTGTTPTPFQYVGGAGYYRDTSKRTYVRARNLFVNMGRWAETDPIGFEGGDYNLYRYVGNNFVNEADPSGLYKNLGRATCYTVKKNPFCKHSDCKNPPTEMVAALPNVCMECQSCFEQKDGGKGLVPMAKCGGTVTVTTVKSRQCSVTLTVVDMISDIVRVGSIVQISSDAAEKLSKCAKIPKKGRTLCQDFQPGVLFEYQEVQKCGKQPIQKPTRCLFFLFP